MHQDQKERLPNLQGNEENQKYSPQSSTPGLEMIERIKEEVNSQMLSLKIQSLNSQINRLKHNRDQLETKNREMTKSHLIERTNFNNQRIDAEALQQRYQDIQNSMKAEKQLNQQHNTKIKQNFSAMISTMDKILKTRSQMENNKYNFNKNQQIRKKDKQIQELKRFLNYDEEKIKNQEKDLKIASQTNSSLSKRNLQFQQTINQLKKEITEKKNAFDLEKCALQSKYANLIKDLQITYQNLSVQCQQKQKKFKKTLEINQQQIVSLKAKLQETKTQLQNRIISQGQLLKIKESIENSIVIKESEINRHKKQIDKYQNERLRLQNLLIQKSNQLSTKKQDLFNNKLQELRSQFKTKFEDLNISYANKQQLHINRIKTIQQEKLTIKDNYTKKISKLQNQILTIESERISFSGTKQKQIKTLKQQKQNIQVRLGIAKTIIDQMRSVLFKNRKPSQQDQQIPSLLTALLQQKAKTISNLQQSINNLNNSIKLPNNELQATKSLIKSLNEEVSKIKRLSDLISIKNKNLQNYGTTSEILKFIQLIIKIEAESKQEVKKQKLLAENIKKQLSKSQENERILILTNKSLTEKQQKMDIQIQSLTQQLIKIKFDNEIVITNLNFENQSLKTTIADQNIRIQDNQVTLKSNQQAIAAKDKQNMKSKQLIKTLQSQKSIGEKQFDSELLKLSKIIQQKDQKIKASNSANQQLTNRIKLLENQGSTKLNEVTKLNESLENMKRELQAGQASMESMREQLSIKLRDKQLQHNQYIEFQIRKICLTFGEVFEKQPNGNSFDDIITFIKSNTSSSSDTTLSISPILQKMPKERAYLIGQIRKFLSCNSISSTFIYKYDRINSNFINYLPLKTNNFSFVLLMKSKKSGEVFGVVSEGMQKKAFAFNLTRMIAFQPVQKFSKPPTIVVSRYLFFGNNQIKICSSPTNVDVAVFTTIYGDRYFSFSKPDIVGNNEEKENIALQNIEIHQINM